MYDLLINKSSEAGEYQGELLDTTTGVAKKYTMEDMAGVPYDDEKWDEFVSQMSVEVYHDTDRHRRMVYGCD